MNKLAVAEVSKNLLYVDVFTKLHVNVTLQKRKKKGKNDIEVPLPERALIILSTKEFKY